MQSTVVPPTTTGAGLKLSPTLTCKHYRIRNRPQEGMMPCELNFLRWAYFRRAPALTIRTGFRR